MLLPTRTHVAVAGNSNGKRLLGGCTVGWTHGRMGERTGEDADDAPAAAAKCRMPAPKRKRAVLPKRPPAIVKPLGIGKRLDEAARQEGELREYCIDVSQAADAMEKKKKKSEHDESSYSSSGSSSSSDTVLISKPLNQKHRKQLQAQLLQQETDRQAAGDSAASASKIAAKTQERASVKNDLICLVCEQEGDLYLCTGPCVSAFHLKCLGLENAPQTRDSWKCPSCTSSTHVCFHCKRLGVSVNPDASSVGGAGGTATAAQPSAANAEGLRPVRKCRALSCGKFYHSNCISKLPLARIAGSNFICPSGAKKESVRCMRCPVAYHTSCLPKNCVQNFPGKRIICPKHERSSSTSQNTVSALAVSSSSHPPTDTAAKDRKTSKELKPSKMERGDVEKVRTLDTQRSIDRQSQDDKSGDDIKSEASGAVSSSSKKVSKSTKREKKKKKKKRKKAKKRDSKERGHEDGDEEDESTGTKKASRTDSDDDDDDEENTSHAEIDVKREGPYNLPSLNVPFPEAVSPATSSSLFESPATTNEKIKARLVEALGQSDDDVESLDNSPITLPKPKSMRFEVEERTESPIRRIKSPDRSPDRPSLPVQQDHVSMTQDIASPLPAPPIHSDATENSSMPQLPPASMIGASALEEESSHSANGYASNSQSSGEKALTSARKARKEGSSSLGGKDLKREFNEVSDRKSSKKKQHLYCDLSLQIPDSPAQKRGLNSPGGTQEQDAVEHGGISEGEEGDDEGPGGSSTPTLRRRTSTGGTGTPRGDTADDSKGKMTSSSRPSKKKKKKKTKSSTEHTLDASCDETQIGQQAVGGEDGVAPEEKDEAKWVQCDSCKKWRTVPKDIDLNSMPERWYCKMNTWDSVYASCTVAEEVVNATSKKPKSSAHKRSSKSKIKAKPQPGDQEAAGAMSDGGASSPSSGSGSQTSKKASSEVEGATPLTVDEKSKLTKKQEKQAKKRKLKLKLKEKYREVKWVQCESAQCGKWRVVPSSIDFNLLPAVWYCHLNTWSPEIAKCTAPNPPEVDTFLMKSRSKKGGSSSSSGSRPSKKLKPTSEASVSTPTATNPASLGSETVAGGSLDVSAKPSKPTKAPKGAATPATSQVNAKNSASDSGPAGANSNATTSVVSFANGEPGNSNGGAPGSSIHSGSHNPMGISNNAIGGGKGRKVKPDGIKKTVLEWAQCEKCNKWRKLPQHIKSSTLPDKWYCSMNHWDPVRASCSIPEEVDQEPVGASPLPSSQNWYPMPGQVGGNGGSGAGGMRSKRSKLSYTELLYASTGQLRKTYTSESSTLTFEHGGRTYQRDGQYKDSSMYVSPDSIMNLNKQKGENSNSAAAENDSFKQALAADIADNSSASDKLQFGAPDQPSVEQVATLVLDAMDLRRSSTVAELLRAVNGRELKGTADSEVGLSLSLVTAAVSHLVQKGLIEKQDSEQEVVEQLVAEDEDTAVRVGSKRRKTSEATLLASLSATFQYRKVPKRPLKASKCWRLGQSAFEFPLKE